MIHLIGHIDNKQVFKRLLRLDIMTKRKRRLALFEIGRENILYIKELMAEKKTGRIYKINGVEHQASAPGEAPAILTGELQRSLFYNVSGSNYLEYGADTEYAGRLEHGDDAIDARPYLIRAAIDKNRESYNTLVKYGLEAFRA